jgi:hypothetical protein
MSEVVSSPASFLNLDLELESSEDLALLAAELGRRAFVLYSGPISSGYRLSLEPLVDGKLSGDPSACTEYFLNILEALAPECAVEFRGCRSRVFDYGFDGGLEANPIHTDLASAQLVRIAALDISVRITTYPYRAAGPEDESAEARVDA